ncbi:YcnI family copper-binding membrane protein (plasmid) [Limimaricola variabilis]
MSIKTFSLATALIVATAQSALAHATLEQKSVTQNATEKLTVRIGHGCDGAPTLRVRVRIPEGMIAVKPMPKAGWTLETAVEPYATPYDYYGNTLTEGVQEIVWSGELDDAHYDEFVFRAHITEIAEADQVLYVPVVQECADAAERWIETPGDGQSSDDLEMPAPGVMVQPAAAN